MKGTAESIGGAIANVFSDSKKTVSVGNKTLKKGQYAIVRMTGNDKGQFAWKCGDDRKYFRFTRSYAGEEIAVCAEWKDAEVTFSTYRFAVGSRNALGYGSCPQSSYSTTELGRMCAIDKEGCYDRYFETPEEDAGSGEALCAIQ